MNTLTPFIRHEMDNLPNDTHGRANTPDSMESHCVPFRQKNARDFLAGNTPGVMAFYAPESTSRSRERALQQRAPTACPEMHDLDSEDDETVMRLVEWREESPDS